MDFNYNLIKASNAQDAYRKMTKLLDEKGHELESRGELTKEILNVAVEIVNPRLRSISIKNLNIDFLLHEMFDILNSNDPTYIHSREQLEKTMGNSSDPLFFGNELRQAFSLWSLRKLRDRFIKDKNTRKGVLNLGNRRNNRHTPCMLFAHFIIRDNKLYLTVETRATAVSMGFINDIFFMSIAQEIMLGWLRETYPELELGSLVYKTISLHTYLKEVEKNGKIIKEPLWNQTLTVDDEFQLENPLSIPFDLTYNEYLQDMGMLYNYVNMVRKAKEEDNIDSGHYIIFDDLFYPEQSEFNSMFFYHWAVMIIAKVKDNIIY